MFVKKGIWNKLFKKYRGLEIIGLVISFVGLVLAIPPYLPQFKPDYTYQVSRLDFEQYSDTVVTFFVVSVESNNGAFLKKINLSLSSEAVLDNFTSSDSSVKVDLNYYEENGVSVSGVFGELGLSNTLNIKFESHPFNRPPEIVVSGEVNGQAIKESKASVRLYQKVLLYSCSLLLCFVVGSMVIKWMGKSKLADVAESRPEMWEMWISTSQKAQNEILAITRSIEIHEKYFEIIKEKEFLEQPCNLKLLAPKKSDDDSIKRLVARLEIGFKIKVLPELEGDFILRYQIVDTKHVVLNIPDTEQKDSSSTKSVQFQNTLIAEDFKRQFHELWENAEAIPLDSHLVDYVSRKLTRQMPFNDLLRNCSMDENQLKRIIQCGKESGKILEKNKRYSRGQA